MPLPRAMAHPTDSNTSEVRASLVLFAAALLALIAANSMFASAFKSLWATKIAIGVAPYVIEDSLKAWIKNGLMAVFFLHVGLEIKAQFLEGALADRKRATLPIVAAAGGIVVPALIFLAIARSDPAISRGWAIPTATDIAFAVGVVGLLGKRVPAALKAFLLAVAVIDDLAAILVIAIFYTGNIAPAALGFAVAITLCLQALNQFRVAALWPYLLVGVLLWIATYHAGVSPTLAGVIVAAFIPLRAGGHSPLHHLEQALRPWVLFGIMPLFAVANAGVPFTGLTSLLTGTLTQAIAIALIVGKPVGILGAVLLSTAAGFAELPRGANMRQLAGVGALAGIGFTMSLFIGDLAFGSGPAMDDVRLGVLTGSLISGLIGYALLRRA